MGSLKKEGDSWFSGEKPGGTNRTQGDGEGRDDALLHVRGPPLDAGLDQGAAACLPDPQSEHSIRTAPPGAPSLPRRPGRWRARDAGPRRRARPGARVARRGDRPGGGAVPRAAADPAAADRGADRAADPPRRAADPARPQDPALDLRRQLPRADDPPARRGADRGHLPPRAARQGGRTERPPARRPQPHPVRRPARRPDRRPAVLRLLQHRPRPLAARLRQRPADPAGGEQTLRLRPARGRAGPNAPRSSGTTTTASTGPPCTPGTGWPGCSSSTTSTRPRCRCPKGTATSPWRSPTAASTTATSSPTRSPTGARPPTGSPARRCWSTAPTCPTTGSRRAAIGCGSSTSPSSAPTTSTSRTARR